MQYHVQTPVEYLESLDPDWRRETLEELRSIIMSCAPDLTEGISYGMLSYGDERGLVFGLNAQKNYVSLYVGNARKVDPDGSLLQGLSVGKGCIRFTKSKVVSETRIGDFIERAVAMWRRGEDIDC